MAATEITSQQASFHQKSHASRLFNIYNTATAKRSWATVRRNEIVPYFNWNLEVYQKEGYTEIPDVPDVLAYTDCAENI